MTKILVVDDEEDVEILIRQKFSKQLKSKELEFFFASNGIEALKTLFQNNDINIILTDINMPEMDGLTLLSHLPELKRLFKAIIISAYGDMTNIRKAMNRGACDFITKPIDFNDLEITISNTIEQYTAMKRALEAESKLSDLEKELLIAYKIQQAIIPHNFNPFPDNNHFEILGKMIPKKEVGGDFFDFFMLDNNKLAFVIADVSGKSISAALFMSMTRAIIRSVSKQSDSPEKCLTEANRILCVDNDACMFVTTFYGILEVNTGKVLCANAGHNPPFILKADQTLQEIARNEGVPLGVTESTEYGQHNFVLEKGDCLILYTDGITEAMNSKRDLYTEARFIESLKKWSSGKLSTLINHILNDIEAFTQDVPSADDITLLCIKRNL
jgi:sigma-B regulation protein RsbU (phosphoserine phosphatase)